MMCGSLTKKLMENPSSTSGSAFLSTSAKPGEVITKVVRVAERMRRVGFMS